MIDVGVWETRGFDLFPLPPSSIGIRFGGWAIIPCTGAPYDPRQYHTHTNTRICVDALTSTGKSDARKVYYVIVCKGVGAIHDSTLVFPHTGTVASCTVVVSLLAFTHRPLPSPAAFSPSLLRCTHLSPHSLIVGITLPSHYWILLLLLTCSLSLQSRYSSSRRSPTFAHLGKQHCHCHRRHRYLVDI
jgi:hypothetical protein